VEGFPFLEEPTLFIGVVGPQGAVITTATHPEDVPGVVSTIVADEHPSSCYPGVVPMDYR